MQPWSIARSGIVVTSEEQVYLNAAVAALSFESVWVGETVNRFTRRRKSVSKRIHRISVIPKIRASTFTKTMTQTGTGGFEDCPLFFGQTVNAVSRNLLQDGVHLAADEFLLGQLRRLFG